MAQASESKAHATYGQLPLAFVPNADQIDHRVRFSTQMGGASFFLTQKDAVFSFAKGKGIVLRLAFLGASPKARIEGQKRGSGKINYLLGNDPSAWRTDLPTYEEVVYRELWPGIDLVISGVGGALKYEFRLAPGARVPDIRLAYRGADRLALGSRGDLLVETPLGRLRDTHPRSHQLVGGRRVRVASRFMLGPGADGFRFRVGTYDPSRPLLIDPGLVYSSFLGGGGFDQASGNTVGADGSLYVTGVTSSPNLPPGTGQATFHGGASDAFVTKLSAAGSHVYTTLLGGSGAEHAHAIYDGLDPLGGPDMPYGGVAVDAAGNAHLTGVTCSSDFPVQAAYQPAFGGSPCDAFVAKLNPAGNAPVYSTYLGGFFHDGGSDIALGADGSAYLAGFTSAPNFPIQNAFQPSHGGLLDAFVAKLSADGSTLVFSSYLGGSADDWARDIVVDASGNAYATGNTQSASFPTTLDAHQTTLLGPRDGFVTKVSAAGARIYSTLLGGAGSDDANGIAVAGDGSAYVTGTIFGLSVRSAYVRKLNAAANMLTYSAQFGGTGSSPGGFGDDRGFDIAVDAAGNAYVTGSTQSGKEPQNAPSPVTPFRTTTNAAQPGYGGGSDDAFVVKLSPSGSGFAYSSYLGGSGFDVGTAITLGSGGKVYVSGFTSSANFPLSADAAQSAHGGGTQDAFVTTLETDLAIQPTTYQVNSNADPGDGVCDATCTMRDAILASNLLGAKDTIAFDLPAGQTTIAPSPALPTLLDPVIVDGSTQPGFAGTPIVELSGINAGATASGLVLSPSPGLDVDPRPAGGEGGSTVRALVINRFAAIGLGLVDFLHGGNTIVGNFIGTDLTGRNPRGNGTACVSAPPSCSTAGGGISFTSVGENRIGGPAPEDRNVVAGNDGIRGPQILTNTVGSSGFLRVEGNHIGVNVLGISMPLNQPGCCYGTNLDINGPGGMIADNRIGMGAAGIEVTATSGGPGFTIKGNQIGGNGTRGTFFGIDVSGAGKVVVGTPEPGGANVISFNNGTGIRVNAFTAHAQIRFNRIFANGLPTSPFGNALGIDLGQAGVTPNDPGDSDTGPNGLQNFPELSSVTVGAASTTIEGTLNSTPDTTFLIDFYSNVAGADSFSGKTYTACDASGYGEGETYLGTTSVTTDASGAAPFSHTVSAVFAAGAVVTATATDTAGNTSEFSECEAVPEGPGTGTIVVDKVANPAGDPQSFNFDASSGSYVDFSLTDAATPNSQALAAGSYAVSETVPSGWDLTSATCTSSIGDAETPTTIELDAGETVTCTFTNTKRGRARVIKTVRGSPPSGSQSFTFELRQGASPTNAGTVLESKPTNAANGGVVDFTRLLVSGTTYAICEIVMPGWMTTLGPPFYVVYNPSGDNSTVCTDFTVSPGETKVLAIDNQPPPGGLGRTIGFWKNWASCSQSKGKQRPVLDQTLALAEPGGVRIGDLVLHAGDCLKAVRILDKSTINTGTKKASDPAFSLAAQLLAAKLNVVAGAGTCPAAVTAINAAHTLLDAINFDGITHATMTAAAQTNQANGLATTLDRYNNNLLC